MTAVVDGQSSNIENQFSSIYKTLYNSVDDQSDVTKLYCEVSENIDHDDLVDVKKVTPSLVKEAVGHLNNAKTDPVYDFSSDCIKNGPDILYNHLAAILQSFLIHSHVSLHLLLAVLVPLVKDRLGNISSSKNYRSIAISSLLLKTFDWIVILLFGAYFGLTTSSLVIKPAVQQQCVLGWLWRLLITLQEMEVKCLHVKQIKQKHSILLNIRYYSVSYKI